MVTIVVGDTALGGWIGRASGQDATAQIAASTPNGSCFLLHEVGVGEIRRQPSVSCRMRVSPQSTFKIPHALAALDAGVVTGPDSQFAYDGSPQPFDAWRRDHTLQSAMRFSVVWWFQRVAEKLGAGREREYLRRLGYGNADSSSGLTTFWLGGSLVISPDEQMQFLLRLFANDLPVSQNAMSIVRAGPRPTPRHGRQCHRRTHVRRHLAQRHHPQGQDRQRPRQNRPAGQVARRPGDWGTPLVGVRQLRHRGR